MTEKPFTLTDKQQEALKRIGGAARHFLLRGGSRSGKTFLIIYAILIRALMTPNSRHAIFRRYAVNARASIWKSTLPDVVRKCFPGLSDKITTNETEMLLTLPNGATIMVGGLDDKERIDKILGLEFATIYVNESSEIHDWQTISTVLTRLAQKVEIGEGAKKGQSLRPKFFADCNPAGGFKHWTYQAFIQKVKPGTNEPFANPDNYDSFQINPADNAANIDADYLASLADLPLRERRRFLEGEWVNDIDGALFSIDQIERDRVMEAPDDLKRIIVAVDPAVSSGKKSDKTGIVVVGLGRDDRGYVLADRTVARMTPDQWARVVVDTYHEFGADKVVAERNQGGQLVETVIRGIEPNIPYASVWAGSQRSKSGHTGKGARAEPVSALYERGKVSHVGAFPELEDQLCQLTPAFDARRAGFSPDHADALVWGLTELMLGGGGGKIMLGKMILG